MDIPKDIVEYVNRKNISFGFGSKLIAIGIYSKIGHISLAVIKRKKAYEVHTINISFYSESNDYTKLIEDIYNNIKTEGIMDTTFNYNKPNNESYSCEYDFVDTDNILKVVKNICKTEKTIRFGASKFCGIMIPVSFGEIRLSCFKIDKECICFKLFINSSDNDIIEIYETFCKRNGVECNAKINNV